MLTFGVLGAQPERFDEVGEHAVLIACEGSEEASIGASRRRRDSTMVFQHETIKIMKAERAEQLEALREKLTQASAVLPIRQRGESMWEYVTVGRASTADIIVDDPAISNVHAHFELDYQDGSVLLQDVGSSNGTFVNRQQIQPHTPVRLRSGDVVRFGQTLFFFVANSMLRELLER